MRSPDSAQLLWIVDIYGFMIAGSLVTMGTLGDRISRRKLLLFGGAAFGVAGAQGLFLQRRSFLSSGSVRFRFARNRLNSQKFPPPPSLVSRCRE